MSKTITIYKFLTSEMKSANGNSGVWKLGKWKKWDGKLKLCKCGFHGSESPLDSLQNIWGDVWAVGEVRGNTVRGSGKYIGKLVASEMRITKLIDTKKACVEFAVACAERCLHKFEEQYPNDDRPSKAIDAAKAWLLNPCEETKEAARSAVWSAARSAESAAWSARSAAWSAARSAAWSAAWSAAESAESAVWSAAGSAAWSARSAARSAAWSAARSAAWSAAWSAAGRKWQEAKLKEIIERNIIEEISEQ